MKQCPKLQRFLLLTLLSSLILSHSTSASVLQEETDTTEPVQFTEKEQAYVDTKKALRAAHKNDNVKLTLAQRGISSDERRNKVSELYSQLLAYDITTEESVSITQQLNELGIYFLDTPTADMKDVVSVRSSQAYMDWRSVRISYDSYNDTWTLGAGGNWTVDDWVNDISFTDKFLADEGYIANIGGADGVGIRLYQTSGDFYPTTLEDSYLYISDGYGNSHTSYTRTSGINPSEGVFFEFQDYATCIGMEFVGLDTFKEWRYFGRNFSVFAVYSSSFEEYNGYAEIQYVHTWDNQGIDSISVGASTSGEFQISYNNDSENKFSVTSNTNTVF